MLNAGELLLLIDSVPLISPSALGVPTPMIVQLLGGGRVAPLPQVPPVRVNTLELKVKNGLPRLTVAPLAVRVKVIAPLATPTLLLPNAPEGGAEVSSGTTAAVPVPVRVTTTGALLALLAIDSVAVLAPEVVGR